MKKIVKNPYFIAAFSIALATYSRHLIDPFLGDHLPFITYFVLIMFASYYGNIISSVLSVSAGYLLSDYLFVSERYTLTISDEKALMSMMSYIFVTVSSVILIQFIKRSRNKSNESARTLLLEKENLKLEIEKRQMAEFELMDIKQNLEEQVVIRTTQLAELNNELRKEIKEHLNSEIALRESEEKYRNIIETAYEGICILDANGRFTYVNNRMKKYLECEDSDLKGQTLSQFFDSSEDNAEITDIIEKTEYDFDNITITLRSIKGNKKTFSVSSVSVKNENNQYIGSQMVFNDITDRIIFEKELQLYKDQLEELVIKRTKELHDVNEKLTEEINNHKRTLQILQLHFENTPLAIVEWDEKYNIKAWSKSAENMFGWSSDEMTGKNINESGLVYSSDWDKVEEIMDKMNRNIQPSNVNKNRNYTKDGSIIECEWYNSSLMDEAGELRSVFSIVQDVTERNDAFRKVEGQRALLEAINDVFKKTIVAKDEAEVSTICLEKAKVLTKSVFGFIDILNEDGNVDAMALNNPGWDACSMPKNDAVVLLKNNKLSSYWGRIMRNGKAEIINEPSLDKDCKGVPDGHPEIKCLMGVPLYYSDKVIGIIGLANKPGGFNEYDMNSISALSDAFVIVLKRKQSDTIIGRLNEERKEKITELENAYKELESFTYSVSHDLRAPLRSIEGFTRILKEDYEDKLDEDGRRLTDIISINSRKMGDLINDLLEFSRTSRKELVLSDVDIKDTVNNVMTELQMFAGSNMKIDIKDMPVIKADRTMMHQAFINLISNAIKFSSKRTVPQIEIGTKTINDELVFYVKDNGVGFDMKNYNKLFGVFQRLHNDEEFEGTGVGLAIVNKIINKHNGRIWAESVPESGTTFYFTLKNHEDQAYPGLN